MSNKGRKKYINVLEYFCEGDIVNNKGLNSKGFTLIEILAVVVLLSLIMFFATRSVMKAIENSKLKSEEILVKKIEGLVDDYIDSIMLNGGDFVKDSNIITFKKCRGSCKEDEFYMADAYFIKKNEDFITLDDLISIGLVSDDDFVNPKDNYKCGSDGETLPNIYLFKDSDYVYYYFVDLRDYCNIGYRTDDDGSYVGIINTLPNEFCNAEIDEDGNKIGDGNRGIITGILGGSNVDAICGE